MKIESFQDMVVQCGLPQKILDGIETRLSASSGGAPFQFTGLQKKAFNHEDFWNKKTDCYYPKHIILQGATSAGKTLISEMAILESLYLEPKKKAIVLVPLKAMVRERCDHLEKDLAGKHVYASSSDFLDHDADIINGNYDVAVIVYEKFFAMLSQAANAILKDCSILVVDELQMLSSEGRGPKLEISIQKVMRHNTELGSEQTEGTYTRIMCLTTCDCSVSYIKKWLTIDKNSPSLIEYDKRPVGLEEYIIQLDGRMQGRYVPGERDPQGNGASFCATPAPIPVTVRNGNLNSWHDIYDAKLRLLCALVKHLCGQKPELKILVFVAEKKETVKVAQYLKAEGVFPHCPLSDELRQKLDEYDVDDNQKQLIELFSYRIAFHNASMMASLRELVETQLMSNGEDGLRLVVATETLTIGMNMPVDVMILFDHEVPRGPQRCALTSQEYKNFVGRAGRLGLSDCVGKSYLFARDEEERESLWEKYVGSRKEEISSALIYADAVVQAPYYLSLLTPSRSYHVFECEQMQDSSFSQASCGRRIDMSILMKELKKSVLVQPERVESDFDDADDDISEEYQYHLTNLGQQMAPYALCLETVKELRRVFLNGGYRRRKDGTYEEKLAPGKGGFPLEITESDLNKDRYLLDILYVLCRMKEVVSMGQLRLPSGENGRVIKQRLYEQLKNMTQFPPGEDEHYELWPQSALKQIQEGLCEDEEGEYQALMRALLLWYWTKGKRISEMRKSLPFIEKINLYSGDLARIAEVVSYQLDAVYRCATNISQSIRVKFDERGPRAIYSLSTRVNYGMPRDLVIIANRHVYGLDRLTVLKIGSAAKQYGYDTPVAYLDKSSPEQRQRIITESQHNELLSKIDRIYLRDDFDSLLSSLQDNPKGSIAISENEIMALKQLHAAKFSEESLSLQPLGNLFWTKSQQLAGASESHKYFSGEIVVHDLENSLGQLIISDRLTLNLGCFAEGDNFQRVVRLFKAKQPNERNLLFVDNQELLELLVWDGDGGCFQLRNSDKKILLDQIDLAMTLQSFAVLLAHTVAMNDRSGMLLSALLRDVDGAFVPKGIKELYHLLKNYQVVSTKTMERSAIRIVWDWRLLNQEAGNKLTQALTSHGIPFRRIAWGRALEQEDSKDGRAILTVLYLNRESLDSSRSVKEFCQKLRDDDYQNVLALFDDEAQYQNWTGTSSFPEWKLIHRYVTDMEQAALNILGIWQRTLERIEAAGRQKNTFLIGVSYSHILEQGEERPASRWLRELVKQLNDYYGCDQILYDRNQPELFSRGNAILDNLELYRNCAYFLVLDDHYYTFGKNCPREFNVIQEVLEQSPEQRRRIWFLRPNNEDASILFDPARDYCQTTNFTPESTQTILEEIKQVIGK